jgi:hypothetical protein
MIAGVPWCGLAIIDASLGIVSAWLEVFRPFGAGRFFGRAGGESGAKVAENGSEPNHNMITERSRITASSKITARS